MQTLITNPRKRLESLFPFGFKHARAITALAMFGAACVVAAPKVAEAFTAPTAGTFAYDIYDIGVNQILKGPIGFAAGVGAMVAAAVMAIRQMLLPAAATVLGGAFLLKADSVVSSLGALIN
ncbi:MAG: hypothetical protein M0T76_00435 [Desulfobacteraceae bacterium]|nr:hypothetical protein [Desulfobacteraceae bacterium]